MKQTVLIFLIALLCIAPAAASDFELVPVFDSEPVFEYEEITLEVFKPLKYQTSLKEIETYKSESEKERSSSLRLFKKGRVTLDAGVSNKIYSMDKELIKIGDKVLLQPSLQVTDQFSLIMVDKVNPKTLDSEQELGFKINPKKIKHSSFSVLGTSSETKQKIRFSTDFYLW